MNKLQVIVAVAALAVTSAANASLNDFTTGNGSLAFIAYDNVSVANPALGSVFVDLGFHLNDFDPTLAGNVVGVNNKIVWNFANNTITKNGNLVVASNDFSAFGSFIGAHGDDAKWGVIAGDSISFPQRILTTGTPTATQLAQQNSSTTAGALAVQNLFVNSGVSNAVDNGSYFSNSAADNTYVAKTTNFSSNWQNKLKWQSTTTNSQTNFWMAMGDGSEMVLGNSGVFLDEDSATLLNHVGTFTLDKAAGTLTWDTGGFLDQTAPLPEPKAHVLALLALSAIGLVCYRRSMP
ncbi:hypothetical protein [Aquabacterium sp.]|uniref:hypothetical protein n=1 Tax=Aquabacterium sp. TaxID=1872578 RepID=UPI0019CD62C8|nr:hypothetical protein [Aquabacterium sp.]MBC7702024.1 hypothetical protein [Aquabacterium sp.]